MNDPRAVAHSIHTVERVIRTAILKPTVSIRPRFVTDTTIGLRAPVPTGVVPRHTYRQMLHVTHRVSSERSLSLAVTVVDELVLIPRVTESMTPAQRAGG